MNPSTTRTLARQGQPTGIEPVKPGTIPPQLRAYLDSLAPSIAKVLPKHLSASRMIKLFGGLAAANPKIAECSLSSIANVMVTCSQLGLEVGPLGHVYVIPRRQKGEMHLTMQLGYKGYYELARRSGKIKRMSARVVYQQELDLGLFIGSHEPPEITHLWKPGVLSHDDLNPINIVAAYCVVETDDGGRYQWIMDRHEIERRRLCNPAVQDGRSNPWDTDYAAMASKCPVRALFGSGVVPMSSELAEALEADDDGSSGRTSVAADVAQPVIRTVDVEVVTPEPEPDPPTDVPNPEPQPAQERRSKAKGSPATPQAPAPSHEPPAKPEVPDPDRQTQEARQAVQALRDELKITSREYNDALAACDLVGIPVTSWSMSMCNGLMDALEAQANARSK